MATLPVENTSTTKRNLDAERKAIGMFQSNFGKSPETSKEWSVIHRYAYPTYSELPGELKAATSEADYNIPVSDLVKSIATGSSSATSTSTTPLVGTNLAQQGLTEAQKQMDVASGKMQQLTQGGGSFFTTLQNALREKMGYRDSNIGQSELYKQAGLLGFDTLAQSLSMRNQELDSSRVDLQNTINNLAGGWRAQAELAKTGYEQAFNKWKELHDELVLADRDARAYKQAIDTAKIAHSANVELSKSQLITEKTVDEEGIEVVKYFAFNPLTTEAVEVNPFGASVSGRKITTGEHQYDMSTYAADPSYVVSLNKLVGGIGKFENEEQLTNYLQKKNSTITTQMVQNASSKYEVPWEMIVGVLEKESLLGTSNVAVKNNNPGGITWSETYQTNHPEVTKGTLRPPAEGGNYVKFNTMQGGVNAVVEQIAKREIARPEGYFLKEKLKNLATSGSVQYVNKEMATSFKQGIEREMKIGGWDAAFNFAKTAFYNRMGSTEKGKLVDSEVSRMSFGQAQNLLAKPGMPEGLNLGPWNNISEKKIKPWLGITKNQATAELNQFIEYGQAKLRNTLFGSQLTAGELALSQNFLIDFTKDDITTINLKLDNLVWLSQNYEDVVFGRSLGLKADEIPAINKMPHAIYTEPTGSPGGSQVETSEQDLNYINSLGL